MQPRTYLSLAVTVALIVAGTVVLPRPTAEPLPAETAASAFPDTVDGVPLAEAPARSVVTLDRDRLVAVLDRLGAETDGSTVRSRTPAGTDREVGAHQLTDSDRELLEAFGLLEPGSAGRAAASADGLADAEVAALFATRVTDHLAVAPDVSVTVEPVIGDRFAVTGAAAAALEGLEEVLAAEDAVLGMVFADPAAEPLFSTQWGLDNTGQSVLGTSGTSGVDLGWTGALHHSSGRGLVVAVVDTPFDTSHPDLQGRWWVNPDEQCGAGEDLDDNGYAGDCGGWNFATGGHDVAGGGQASDHATHVAGTIAAGLNGVGGVGVAPNATIMPLVVGTEADTAFPMDRVAQAIGYAVDNGADIINLSLGTAPMDWDAVGTLGALEEAMQAAREAGVLVVAAAGNQGVDLEETPVFPASYASPPANMDPALDNLLVVAAMDSTGGPWITDDGKGTNRGADTVHLAAPGVSVMGPTGQGQYRYYTGTSMAAPHVAGVATLLLERVPSLTGASLADEILDTGGELDPARWGADWTSGDVRVALDHWSWSAVVIFSELGGTTPSDGGPAALTTTMTITPPEGVAVDGLGPVTATLIARHEDELYAVVDHPMTVVPGDDTGASGDGSDDDAAADSDTELRTDEEGAVTVALLEGAATLTVDLPAGDYGWVVEFAEATGLAPHVAAFRVAVGGDEAGGPDDPPIDPLPDPIEEPDDTTNDGGGEEPAGGDDEGAGGGQEGGDTPGTGDDSQTDGSDTDGDDDAGGGDDGGGDDGDGQAPGGDDPATGDGGGDDTTGGGGDDTTGGGTEEPVVEEPEEVEEEPLPDAGEPAEGSAISPSAGHPGDLVTIRGDWTNVHTNAKVRFADRPAIVSSSSELMLQVAAPWSASTGPVDVTVYQLLHNTDDGSPQEDILATFPGGFTYLSTDGEPAEDPESDPPAEGGDNGGEGTIDDDELEPPGEEETEFDTTGRTWGPDQELPGGLTGVALGSGHPGYGLHAAMWPPACTVDCAAMPGRG